MHEDNAIEVEFEVRSNVVDAEIDYTPKVLEADIDTNIRVEKNYDILVNKPRINNVELVGNRSASELNIKTSQLINDGDGNYPFATTMSIKNLQKNIDNKIRTVDIVPSDMKAGDYIFLNEGEVK